MTLRLSAIEGLVLAGLLFFGASAIHFAYARSGLTVPSIICEAPNVELGVITTDDPIDCLFTVRNGGRALLQIDDVKTSCACTVVPFYQNRLKPGESTVIPVRMDVKDRHGTLKQYVILTTNDPAHPQFPLRLTADVEISAPNPTLGTK